MIYGEKQAQVLTKTLLVNELPDNVQKLAKNAEISKETEIQVKNSILHAHLFDAHQEKLAKRKNPENPMWNYARDWGITDKRKKYSIMIAFFDKYIRTLYSNVYISVQTASHTLYKIVNIVKQRIYSFENFNKFISNEPF